MSGVQRGADAGRKATLGRTTPLLTVSTAGTNAAGKRSRRKISHADSRRPGSAGAPAYNLLSGPAFRASTWALERTARGTPRRTVSSTPALAREPGPLTTPVTVTPAPAVTSQCSEQGTRRALTLQARTLATDHQRAPDELTRRRRARDPSPLPQPGGSQTRFCGSETCGHPWPSGDCARPIIKNRQILKCKGQGDTAEILREGTCRLPVDDRRPLPEPTAAPNQKWRCRRRGIVTACCNEHVSLWNCLLFWPL